MTTPAMAFGTWLRTAFLTIFFLGFFTVVISWAYICHEAYYFELDKRDKERYLLHKCQDPEFFHNIRLHTDLCSEVEANARQWLLGKAAIYAFGNTYICGKKPCSETLGNIVSRLGWQACLLLAVLAFVSPNILYHLMHFHHLRNIRRREMELRERHNRYGTAYYQAWEGLDGIAVPQPSTALLSTSGLRPRITLGQAEIHEA